MRTVYVTDPVLLVVFFVLVLIVALLISLAVLTFRLKARADESDHRHTLCSHRASALWEVLPEEARREWSPAEDAYEGDAESR